MYAPPFSHAYPAASSFSKMLEGILVATTMIS